MTQMASMDNSVGRMPTSRAVRLINVAILVTAVFWRAIVVNVGAATGMIVTVEVLYACSVLFVIALIGLLSVLIAKQTLSRNYCFVFGAAFAVSSACAVLVLERSSSISSLIGINALIGITLGVIVRTPTPGFSRQSRRPVFLGMLIGVVVSVVVSLSYTMLAGKALDEAIMCGACFFIAGGAGGALLGGLQFEVQVRR